MKTHFAPGATDISGQQGPRGMLVAPNGAPSVPAGAYWLFCHGDGNGEAAGGFGVMCMTVPGGPGLHITLTPDGLREWARQCESVARDLEATAGREAAEAIERAKGAGK